MKFNNELIPWSAKVLGLPALFIAASVSAAPSIGNVEGEIKPEGKIVISGKSFGDKTNDRPLFYWSANNGILPRTDLARQGWSGSSFNGEISKKVVHPTSKASVAWDHGASSGKALEWVDYNSSHVYVFRKKLSDFDTTKDLAIRTRFDRLSGEFREGQLVRGLTSGATGIIESVNVNSDNTSGSIFYKNVEGSINSEPRNDFMYGEKLVSDTAAARNSEGTDIYPTGTYRTFNYKIIRFWAEKTINNVFVGPDHQGAYEMKMTPEYTSGSIWSNDWQSIKRMTPGKWLTEEFLVYSGSIDQNDARLVVRTDGVLNFDQLFKARTSERPGRYDRVAQSQVSNGAQKGSFIYYDSLYVDDSWHRIIFCDRPKYDECSNVEILIPIEWDNQKIVAQFRESLIPSGPLYLYVLDGDNMVNPTGYPLPLAASPSKVELMVE
ncbi:hypothetical protein DOQ08_00816 [Marinobacter litoralis]|uniref:Uncharacterized protein n=1 Tax=Marinobacter litoralis TaxID=187981 RepID=A0A3M2RLM4_9GAMM|nr:hypothetical protein [Marinobacter litoralis]RMJ06131.1 hypothetical protein DOQ08_00816 [Marinobacter litoralis]